MAKRSGRRAIFGPKKGAHRVQGELTAEGAEAFRDAKSRLGKLAKRTETAVSDGDTIEFLARGPANTRAYLKHASQDEDK